MTDNVEVVTTPDSTIEMWATNHDFWRNTDDDGSQIIQNCWVCGEPTEWVYLDMGFQHLDCEEAPGADGPVRVVRGKNIAAHHHEWEHYGEESAAIPNTERRCSICSQWQHVGLRGPKITWLDGRV